MRPKIPPSTRMRRKRVCRDCESESSEAPLQRETPFSLPTLVAERKIAKSLIEA